jgi:type III secretion protein N (ATPase)
MRAKADTASLADAAVAVAERTKLWTERRLPMLSSQGGCSAVGRVVEVVGIDVVAALPMARLGMLCTIERPDAGEPLLAEVVGFGAGEVHLTAMGTVHNVGPGNVVRVAALEHAIVATSALIGDVVDAYGRSMTGRTGAFARDSRALGARSVLRGVTSPLERRPIELPFITGVRAIDALLTIGRGQRIGIFAGPGAGKTTLLSAIARNAEADVVVFGLIGERGRELQEFVQTMSQSDTAKRMVIVAAGSDRSSLERARAAFTATAIAEAFCEQGANVLLLIDSLTRFARAQREIGIAAGEPAGRGGFPPSFYSALPRLVERTGNFKHGSITSVYTVLSEQDLEADPVADEARSLLDGHIVLSSKLAESGHYPAIDVLRSLSRTMPAVTVREHQDAARHVRAMLARHEGLEFLIRVGEYAPGRVAEDDEAVNARPQLLRFLQQDLAREHSTFDQTCEALDALSVR